MTDRQKPGTETTPAARPRAPSRDEPDSVPVTVAKRAAAEVALGAGNRVMTLVAVGLLAFASVFLMIAWQFGPLVWVEAQQYKENDQSRRWADCRELDRA